MIRVACPPTEHRAVSDLRQTFPAASLVAQKKIQLVEIPGLNMREAVRRHGTGEREVVGIANMADIPDVDVIVLCRVLSGSLVGAIPFLQQAGIAVVVDIDDDYKHLPLMMEARHKIQPERNWTYNWRWAMRACAIADLVTCSTQELVKYAPHGRVQVIRNAIPKRYTTIRVRRDDIPTIGWSGTAASHPGDLESTRGGVQMAMDDTGADFMIVGERKGAKKALGLKNEPYATGLVAHEQFPFKVAEAHVGVAPLALSSFNTSKSSLKIQQNTALGIPWCGSRTPEYELFHKRLVDAGLGDAASLCKPRSRDWHRNLVRHLTRPSDEAQALSEAMREWSAANDSVEVRAEPEWLAAWSRAIQNRSLNRKEQSV